MAALIKKRARVMKGSLIIPVLLGAISLVSACTTAPPRLYEEPQKAGNATIRFELDRVSSLVIIPDGEHCLDAWRFTPDKDPYINPSRPLVIPANQWLAVQVLWIGPGISSCSLLLSFKPAPNGEYVLHTRLTFDECSAEMATVSKSTEGLVQLRRMKFQGFPASCVPIEQK